MPMSGLLAAGLGVTMGAVGGYDTVMAEERKMDYAAELENLRGQKQMEIEQLRIDAGIADQKREFGQRTYELGVQEAGLNTRSEQQSINGVPSPADRSNAMQEIVAGAITGAEGQGFLARGAIKSSDDAYGAVQQLKTAANAAAREGTDAGRTKAAYITDIIKQIEERIPLVNQAGTRRELWRIGPPTQTQTSSLLSPTGEPGPTAAKPPPPPGFKLIGEAEGA